MRFLFTIIALAFLCAPAHADCCKVRTPRQTVTVESEQGTRVVVRHGLFGRLFVEVKPAK